MGAFPERGGGLQDGIQAGREDADPAVDGRPAGAAKEPPAVGREGLPGGRQRRGRGWRGEGGEERAEGPNGGGGGAGGGRGCHLARRGGGRGELPAEGHKVAVAPLDDPRSGATWRRRRRAPRHLAPGPSERTPVTLTWYTVWLRAPTARPAREAPPATWRVPTTSAAWMRRAALRGGGVGGGVRFGGGSGRRAAGGRGTKGGMSALIGVI